MATNRGDAKPAAPTATPANDTPPRDTSAVAPETKALTARETTSDATPSTAPRSAAAPAKASGPTPESKAKAARRTTKPRRAKATRPARTAAGRPARATTPARARAAAAAAPATAARARLAAVAAAPALTAPTAPSTAEAGRDAGHGVGRFNTDLVEAGRSASRTVVDAVEGAGDRLAAYHEQVAQSAPLPWVADLARANADLTRAATQAYVGTARSLLRA